MFPDRPTKLDAALLYYDYKPFAYSDLVERLQTVFGDNLSVKLGAHQDGSFAVISVGRIIMKVSQNSGPLAIEGFAAALMSLFTQHTKPDAMNIVNNHRKNIFVTVGGDAILMPDFAPGEIAPEMESFLTEMRRPEEKPSDILHANRVYIAQMVILELCKMNKPELIHWLQSDKFLTAREFEPANDPAAMALQIHPVMNSTGNDKRGRQMIGFDAYGTEHIIGHHITVDETSLTFENVFTAVQGFVHAVHKSGDLPASGQKVTLKTGAEFKVHHVPANDKHPRPHLRLEVLKTATRKGRKDPKPKRKARGPFKLTRLFFSLIGKANSLVIAIVLALVFGKLLGGTEGLELVTVLGN